MQVDFVSLLMQTVAAARTQKKRKQLSTFYACIVGHKYVGHYILENLSANSRISLNDIFRYFTATEWIIMPQPSTASYFMSYMVKSKPGHLNPICICTRSKVPWKLTNEFSAIRSNFGSILAIFELNDFIYNSFITFNILDLCKYYYRMNINVTNSKETFCYVNKFVTHCTWSDKVDMTLLLQQTTRCHTTYSQRWKLKKRKWYEKNIQKVLY